MYKLKKIFKNEKGQGMVEYGLILATVSIVAILGLSTLGGNIKDQFEGITDSMDISEPGPGYSDEEIDNLIVEGYIPVATAEDLNSVRSTENRIYAAGTEWETENTVAGGLNKKYVQVANIDLSGYSEEGWNPIGTDSTRFTGTYDGGNYAITDLEIKGEGNDYQGLFGYTQGATINNVSLENVNVTGAEWYAGGLVGRAYDGTKISNSYVTGRVTGRGDLGGLVGYAEYSTTISNSYATGTVTGSSGDVGGLVGRATNSTKISNSYSTGSVTGKGWVGGLVGRATVNTNISNSYATGSVTGKGSNTGGLVGTAASSSISNSYATGSVTGSFWYVGGLVGNAYDNTTISNAYATGSVEGTSNFVGGLVGTAGSSSISSSYATGAVTGAEWYAGGLVGYSREGTNIENSYSIGSVTGNTRVGGLAGAASQSNISNSYATGPVKGNSEIGGLVGWAQISTVRNSYWDKGTTNQSISAGGEGELTDEMKKVNTYSSWDTEVWNIVNGKYPTLK